MAQQPARTLFNALAFTAGLVGGFVGLITGVSASPRWRPSRRRTRPSYALAGGGIEQPLATRSGGFNSLRATIVGYTKEEVADALGPPPAAALNSSIPGALSGNKTEFWQANTWYYPFDPARHVAIAVFFDANRAVRVEYLGGER